MFSAQTNWQSNYWQLQLIEILCHELFFVPIKKNSLIDTWPTPWPGSPINNPPELFWGAPLAYMASSNNWKQFRDNNACFNLSSK